MNAARIRGIALQFAVFAAVAWLGYQLLSTAQENLSARGMQTGFGFLSVTAGFDLDFKLIDYTLGVGTYGRIFIIGILNTLLVSVCAIVASTTLAFVVGFMRLSTNWLLSRLALAYVEVIRNTPLLMQIVFWHVSIFAVLPRVDRSLDVFDMGIVFVNNRGFYLPSPVAGELLWLTGLAVLAALVGAAVFRRWARRRQDLTRQRFPLFWLSLAIVVGLPAIIHMAAGAPLDWEIPELRRFNFEGGVRLPPAFVTLFVALTIYHSAHKAETVRSGVQSVHAGQFEAARSLGMRWGLAMRLVVAPQAMRAIVPPMLNGWISLVKNSSLGIAIGYAELTGLFMQTSINQAGHAIEIVAMTMGFYMIVSLTMSGVANLYDRRMRIVEG